MADRESIRQTLCQFLQEDGATGSLAVDDSTDLRAGLGLDSVDFVGLVMRIEGHYRIRLSRDELEALGNVGDLLALVESKVSVPDAISIVAA